MSGPTWAGFGMLAVFALCAALMYARKLPALIAVPAMALALAVLGGAGWFGVQLVLVSGTVRLAPVIAYVIFGALLSRVTMSTGIAETIIAYAAEFGGDRPVVVALILSAAVAALFTSLYGLGAIIMVGSIVLPIMLTIGIPRRTAATLFLLAYALGFIFNVSQWGFYTNTFGVARERMQAYALTLAAIDLLALIVFVIVRFRRTRGYATWALAAAEPPARKRVPPPSLIAPVLPIVLYLVFGLDPIFAFVLAALYAVLTTRPRSAIGILVQAAIRGVEDVAPAILLFMGIGMLLVATSLPGVRFALAPLVTAIAPHNAFGYVLLFGILSPLSLYRGPLNPYGVGIAVYTVLAGLGILPAILLVAAIMAVVQVQNVCDPTNTQNVWVANFTGVEVAEIMRLTLPYQVAVATLATIVAVAFGPALFGIPGPPAVAALLAPASAATPGFPGMFAPASAENTIAVAAAGENAQNAAAAVLRSLQSWKGFRVIDAALPPRDASCATKPYAALLLVSVEPFGDPAVSGNDVGIALEDCAAWPVDQWHETCDAPRGGRLCSARVEESALADLLRVRVWSMLHPDIAASLFARGLAYRSGSGPTYFYTLFKTSDGKMRAFVRPGGPAYLAGLRTNDIVDKIDDKFWWEYGTFQAEQRAYDGKPHTFALERGNKKLSVTLGEPFSEAAPSPAA